MLSLTTVWQVTRLYRQTNCNERAGGDMGIQLVSAIGIVYVGCKSSALRTGIGLLWLSR